MKLRTQLVLPVLVLAAAAPAFGQETQGPPRAYLTAIAGAVVDTEFEHPATAISGEYGERINRDVQAYATMSYVHNLMSNRMRDNLELAGAQLTQSTGLQWQFRGRDRGLAFTAGGKFLLPVNAAVRPYVGGGLGLVNLKRRIIERDLGDVSGAFFEMTGLNDGVIDAGETSVTHPLGELIVGVGGPVGRAYVDVAYRYRKAFGSFEEIAFSQLTAGIGVGFW